MSRDRAKIPNDAAVHLVTRVAVAWAAVGFVTQTVFSVIIAPRIGESFYFSLPGRGPTTSWQVDTSVMSMTGLVVSALALLGAVGNVVLSRANARLSYGFAVIVAIVIPGFAALWTGNAVADLATGGEATIGVSLLVGVAAIAAFMLGALSVLVAPSIVARRAGGTR